MDLGGQVYHEKLIHALILHEGDINIGAIIANLWCGQMDGSKFAFIVESSYRAKFITKPMVVTIKGRGSDEGKKHLRSLQSEFP
jgi:succinyl-CoA synthetase beta subunit